MQQKTHLEVFWTEISNTLPDLSETDDRKESANEAFNGFSEKNNVWIFFCYTSKVQLLTENFNRTLRVLPKKRVFGQNSGDWIDEINVVRKRYNDEKFSQLKQQ